MYDPALARFVSADTHAPDPSNPQDLNQYSYGLNNPVKNTDPTGHCIEDLCIGEAILIGAALTAAEPEIQAGLEEAQPTLEAGAEQASEVLSEAGTGIAEAASAAETKFQELAGQVEEFTGNLLYRNGGRTPANFTPDPIKDVQNGLQDGHVPGLSTFDSIENMMKANPFLKPGSPVQILDPSRLQGSGLRALADNSPLGHVTLTADSLQEVEEWASTRAQSLIDRSWETAHQLTQAAGRAILPENARIPK